MADQLHSNVATVVRPEGASPLLLVCEHASNAIPAQFDQLGLDDITLQSHIAFDPGALDLAAKLSDLLDATLVHSCASRLLYDCNRPPEASDAIPERSEIYDVPGNKGLSHEQKQGRARLFYEPFKQLLAGTLARRSTATAVVTIHSFTPVYNDNARAVELGVLHDNDSRLADEIIASAPSHLSLDVQRNQPYGPEDGVTHTLKLHGIANGLHNVMLEVRNDLLATDDQRSALAKQLSELLAQAASACFSSSVASSDAAGDAL